MSTPDFLPINPTGLSACCLQPEPWATQGGPLWREGLVFIRSMGSHFPWLSQGLQNPRIRGPECPALALAAQLLAFHKGALAPPCAASWKTAKSGPAEEGCGEQNGPFRSILLDPKGILLLPKAKTKSNTMGLWMEQARDSKMHNYFMCHLDKRWLLITL